MFKTFYIILKIFGDSVVGHSVHRLTQLLGTQVDVFYYKFSFVGNYSMFNYPGDKPWGVEHSDEMQYIFEVSQMNPRFTPDMSSYKTHKRVVGFFVNFATSG